MPKNSTISAEQPDYGEGDRRRAGRDAPRAQESAQQLNEMDILQEIGLIGEGRDLFSKSGGAGCDGSGKLSDLLRKRWARRRQDRGEEQGNGQDGRGEHEQPR